MHTVVDQLSARVENCDGLYDVLRASAAALGAGMNFEVTRTSGGADVTVSNSVSGRSVLEVVMRLVHMEATIRQQTPGQVLEQIRQLSVDPDTVPPLPNLDPAAA